MAYVEHKGYGEPLPRGLATGLMVLLSLLTAGLVLLVPATVAFLRAPS